MMDERILKVLENGINRLKTAETNMELYKTLRTISAIAKQESKKVLAEQQMNNEDTI
jgi:hypothetical protein